MIKQSSYCPYCSSPVTAGARFCGTCGRLLTSPPQQESHPYHQPKMNWFQTHLNWTVILFSIFVIAAYLGLVAAIENTAVPPSTIDNIVTILSFMCIFIILPGSSLWLTIWIIRRKNRSLLWLLAVFVFGFIPLLLLRNRTNMAG